MEKLEFEYAAGAPAAVRVMVGVVASGDLEVLVEPGRAGRTTVRITTSVDGYASVWQAQLDRVFKAGLAPGRGPAVEVEINDFGATPGVVGMRIAQAFQAIGTPAGTTA
jgi:malonate decarboxylase delta subunit